MERAGGARGDRVRSAIRHTLAAEISRLKDPRLGFVTVTDVTISPDLRKATVFYTVLGSDSERRSTHVALGRAAGRLRAAVSREVRLRFTPTLEFAEDPIPERARHLEQLIAESHDRERGGTDDPG
ncbi:MAG: 30S ribosome-binding factor RbfA [Acidobacteria bacterium]|nr:30S ribosome-binding factor RbfA [Acidobacteriota bacterium]